MDYSNRTNHSSIDIDVTFFFHKSQNLFLSPRPCSLLKIETHSILWKWQTSPLGTDLLGAQPTRHWIESYSAGDMVGIFTWTPVPSLQVRWWGCWRSASRCSTATYWGSLAKKTKKESLVLSKGNTPLGLVVLGRFLWPPPLSLSFCMAVFPSWCFGK